jgi:hypothetical protein
MNYILQPIAVIVMYVECLHSAFLLFAITSYIVRCLHISSALYRYVFCVITLCYKMYQILKGLKY